MTNLRKLQPQLPLLLLLRALLLRSLLLMPPLPLLTEPRLLLGLCLPLLLLLLPS